MDAEQVAALQAMLARTGWLERARLFGLALRTSTRSPGGLLLVGTPTYEPWHLTAHLDDASRLSGIPELMPTLVRWSPPPDAPPHLRVGLSRLEAARRGETLFVVTEETAPVPLLERVNDARRGGAIILTLDSGNDPELEGLADESLAVPPAFPGVLPVSPRSPVDEASLAGQMGLLTFDAAQHLVSAAAGERGHGDSSGARAKRGLRDRVARLLDIVSGPSA